MRSLATVVGHPPPEGNPPCPHPPHPRLVHELPHAPRSVRLARTHTRRRLTLWNWPGDIEDAVLVTSELVANAVRHGKVPGREVWLRVAVDEENAALTIDVSDPTPVFPVVRKAPEQRTAAGFSSSPRSPNPLIGFCAETSERRFASSSP
ncbi:ATP-binding protein [Streptomyces sp. NBC_00986]|uniref:ATP-binding protein n=1 Tax=Streptomyces sp. NBC_00986 TaxID=2903702 RepID=UPI00386B6884